MSKLKRRPQQRDIYQEVTDTILKHLEQGVVPWRSPIRRSGGGLPKSWGAGGKPYRGINTFLLAVVSWARGFDSDYWLTFNQSKKLGGRVRKGEKGTLVVFWKQHAMQDRETGDEVTVPVLRHYVVFNANQVDEIKPPDAVSSDPETPFTPIAPAERIVAGYHNPPRILHRGGSACYIPSVDQVEIAEPAKFETAEAYYATIFHELAHSTGHRSRLNRGFDEAPSPFGSPDYSKEELVAEMGSAFLCAAAGIGPTTIEQSAAYISGWSKRLSDDKKLIVQAAARGQRAADLILGITFSEADPAEPAPEQN